LGNCGNVVLTENRQELTATAAPVCTKICTCEAETERGAAGLQQLAAELRAGLSADDLTALARLLAEG